MIGFTSEFSWSVVEPRHLGFSNPLKATLFCNTSRGFHTIGQKSLRSACTEKGSR